MESLTAFGRYPLLVILKPLFQILSLDTLSVNGSLFTLCFEMGTVHGDHAVDLLPLYQCI